MIATVLVALTLCAGGPKLDGHWEIQAMGADRQIHLEQTGNTLWAYRVMWPEFQGQKYKLEHLYRARVTKGKIVGKLLVREEGMTEFDPLRAFSGEFGGGELKLDGMPLKKMGPKPEIPPNLVKARGKKSGRGGPPGY